MDAIQQSTLIAYASSSEYCIAGMIAQWFSILQQCGIGLETVFNPLPYLSSRIWSVLVKSCSRCVIEYEVSVLSCNSCSLITSTIQKVNNWLVFITREFILWFAVEFFVVFRTFCRSSGIYNYID